MALAFIDARDVMERLDSVVGCAGWQCSYPHANGKTVCRIEIKIDGEWIGKEDGAGDTDVEAEKGALSDAFKRAAVRWGIGRYLYDMPSPWVEIEPIGRSYRIKDSEQPKLRAVLVRDAKAHAPAPAPPPAEDPFTDPPPNLAALPHAVGLHETYEDLSAWGIENKTAIGRLPKADADKVRAAFATRLQRALKEAKERAAA